MLVDNEEELGNLSFIICVYKNYVKDSYVGFSIVHGWIIRLEGMTMYNLHVKMDWVDYNLPMMDFLVVKYLNFDSSKHTLLLRK